MHDNNRLSVGLVWATTFHLNTSEAILLYEAFLCSLKSSLRLLDFFVINQTHHQLANACIMIWLYHIFHQIRSTDEMVVSVQGFDKISIIDQHIDEFTELGALSCKVPIDVFLDNWCNCLHLLDDE